LKEEQESGKEMKPESSKRLYISMSIFIVFMVAGGTMVSIYWQDISESYRLYQFGIKKWQLPIVEGGPKVPAKAIYIVLKDEKTLIVNGKVVALSDFSQHLSSIAPESVHPNESRKTTIIVSVCPGQTVREFRPLYGKFLIERCGDVRFLASSQNGVVAVPLPVQLGGYMRDGFWWGPDGYKSIPGGPISAWVVKLSGGTVSLTGNEYKLGIEIEVEDPVFEDEQAGAKQAKDASPTKKNLLPQPKPFMPRRISLNDLKTMLKEESESKNEKILAAWVKPDCEFGLLLRFLSLAHQFNRKNTIVDIPAPDIDSKSQEKKQDK